MERVLKLELLGTIYTSRSRSSGNNLYRGQKNVVDFHGAVVEVGVRRSKSKKMTAPA